MIGKQYSRGLDLKFMTDSVVCVIADPTDDLSEVRQMFGRSSRRAEVATGCIVLICSEPNKTAWGSLSTPDVTNFTAVSALRAIELLSTDIAKTKLPIFYKKFSSGWHEGKYYIETPNKS